MTAHLAVLMVAVTLLAAYVSPLVRRDGSSVPARLAVGLSGLCLIVVLVLARTVIIDGPFSYFLGGWQAPWGIEVVVDGPAVFMLATITVVTLATNVYAMFDLKRELGGRTTKWFWTLNLLLMGSMMGIVMARDLFNMFVFVEIASLVACAIISVKGSGFSLDATFRYLIFSSLGTGALLMGIALTYMATGHLNMVHIAGALPGALELYPGNVYAALSFFTLGLGVKAALFPFHTWLPDAHSAAPTPSSAILSGLVVKVFAFAYWRVLTVALGPALPEVPIGILVVILGSLATIIGSILAGGQTNIKRLLAYSTVAQLGYVFIGFGLGGERAVTGAMVYIMAHGMMKAGMFMAAGSLAAAAGSNRTDGIAGLVRTNPLTALAFLVLSLSMVGVPPSAGFTGKWYVAMGALDQGQPLVVAIVVISTALTALYLIPLVIKAFFSPAGDHARVPVRNQVPALVLALLVVVLGVFPSVMIRLMGM